VEYITVLVASDAVSVQFLGVSVYRTELCVAESVFGSVTAVRGNEFGSGRDRNRASSALLLPFFKLFGVFVTGSVWYKLAAVLDITFSSVILEICVKNLPGTEVTIGCMGKIVLCFGGWIKGLMED